MAALELDLGPVRFLHPELEALVALNVGLETRDERRRGTRAEERQQDLAGKPDVDRAFGPARRTGRDLGFEAFLPPQRRHQVPRRLSELVRTKVALDDELDRRGRMHGSHGLYL